MYSSILMGTYSKLLLRILSVKKGWKTPNPWHTFWSKNTILVHFMVKICKIVYAEIPNFPAKFGVWPLAGWMWWGPAQPPPPNSRPTLHFQNEADSSTRTDPQPFWGNFVEKTVGTKFDKLVWICKAVVAERDFIIIIFFADENSNQCFYSLLFTRPLPQKGSSLR